MTVALAYDDMKSIEVTCSPFREYLWLLKQSALYLKLQIFAKVKKQRECKSADLLYTKEILTMPHNNQQLALYPTWVSDCPEYTTKRENVAVILQ